MWILLQKIEGKMKFADLYNYKPFHDLFTESRVRQTASRITQMGRLGNYNAKAEPEDVALFIYVLAASQGTRFVFSAVMQEPELVNVNGNRFVADLASFISAPDELAKIKKVAIGSSVSIIEYVDRYHELYTLGNHFELGACVKFEATFLSALAKNIADTETVEQ